MLAVNAVDVAAQLATGFDTVEQHVFDDLAPVIDLNGNLPFAGNQLSTQYGLQAALEDAFVVGASAVDLSSVTSMSQLAAALSPYGFQLQPGALSDGGLGSLTGGEVIALVDREFTLSFVGGANEGLAVPLDNTLLSELEYFDHTNFGGALDSDTTITVTLTMGVRAVDADSVEFFVEVGDVLTADIRLTSSLDAGDNTINTSELPQGEAWATLSLDIESLSAQLTGGTNGALTATDLGQNLSLTTSLPSQSSAAAEVFFLIDLSTGQPVDPFEAPVPIHSDWRWIVSSDGAELDPLNSPGFDESQLRPALNARIGPGEIAASPHSPIEQW
ncbi:MAG: hypothetical protein KDA37_13020, partial [Planctomycetales bacterium]|nr:hypothetical protein [Planctomycetales bacterium]